MLLEGHIGQGMDLRWKHQTKIPTEKEYFAMVDGSKLSLLHESGPKAESSSRNRGALCTSRGTDAFRGHDEQESQHQRTYEAYRPFLSSSRRLPESRGGRSMSQLLFDYRRLVMTYANVRNSTPSRKDSQKTLAKASSLYHLSMRYDQTSIVAYCLASYKSAKYPMAFPRKCANWPLIISRPREV